MSTHNPFTIEKTGNLENKRYAGFKESLGNDDKLLLGETGYGYMTGVVVDVISEPDGIFSSYFNETKDDPGNLTLKEEYRSNATNKDKIELLPKNSIAVYILDNIESKATGEITLCYPFFPQNFSLPIKPGEHVWIFAEKNRGKSVFYWMCRKTAPNQIDDVNHTFIDRYIKDRSIFNGNKRVTKDVAESKIYSFHENYANQIYPEDVTLAEIIEGAYATKTETVAEPVPRIKKNCGDVLLQGSNNAYIHLTTEKFTFVEDCNELYPKNTFLASENTNAEEKRIPLSPAIDISVAAFKKDLIEIKDKIAESPEKPILETENLSVAKNSAGGYEINKANDNIKESSRYSFSYENLYNIENCGGRIYLSNNCKIDDMFGLEITDFENKHGSCLSLYSEHNRLISSNTVLIANKYSEENLSYISINEEGKINLGTKSGNSGNGEPGLQPFVKGDDLELFLTEFMQLVGTTFETIGNAMSMAEIAAIPITSLLTNSPSVISANTQIDTLLNKIENFKSTLIMGE